MMDYYYSKLSKDEQLICREVIASIKCGKENVCMGVIAVSACERIITSIEYDHPEFYYVNFNAMCFSECNSKISCRINYYPNGIYDSLLIDEVEREINLIVALVKKKGLKSDFEKCRWIHNYIIRNVTYNKVAPDNPKMYEDAFDVRGVFLKYTAVCEGLSKAYKLICDRLNIKTFIVIGRLIIADDAQTRPHAWNIICLDGFFCHVDVTGDLNMSFISKYNRYDYFCCPDSHMKLDHIYEGYPDCITDSYSFFCKCNRYFVDAEKLQKYLDEETKKGTKILYFKTRLPKGNKVTLIEKIKRQVLKTINCSCMYSVNEAQMCFFFRKNK